MLSAIARYFSSSPFMILANRSGRDEHLQPGKHSAGNCHQATGKHQAFADQGQVALPAIDDDQSSAKKHDCCCQGHDGEQQLERRKKRLEAIGKTLFERCANRHAVNVYISNVMIQGAIIMQSPIGTIVDNAITIL